MVASILARLKDHMPIEPEPPDPEPDLVAAGVLVPLFVREEQLRVLFTQRTLMVKDHRGQIAFPAGCGTRRTPTCWPRPSGKP